MLSTRWLRVMAALLLAGLSVVVVASWDGLHHPLAAQDVSAGRSIYEKVCTGCHGALGIGGVRLGLDKPLDAERIRSIVRQGGPGMPPFPSNAISDAQLEDLTAYIMSLVTQTSLGKTEQDKGQVLEERKSPATAIVPTLHLELPAEGVAGRAVPLRATVQKVSGEPVPGATVKFLVETQFFIQGLVELGEAVTNDRGVALLQYTPWEDGVLKVVARYGDGPNPTGEATGTITMSKLGPLYQPEAGLSLPALGPELAVSLSGALAYEASTAAPGALFRLSGATLSWLLLLVLVLVALWGTYFFVLYQTYGISRDSQQEERFGRGWMRMGNIDKAGKMEKSLVPLVGMAVVLTLAITLVLVVLTGPNTHLSLLR